MSPPLGAGLRIQVLGDLGTSSEVMLRRPKIASNHEQLHDWPQVLSSQLRGSR